MQMQILVEKLEEYQAAVQALKKAAPEAWSQFALAQSALALEEPRIDAWLSEIATLTQPHEINECAEFVLLLPMPYQIKLVRLAKHNDDLLDRLFPRKGGFDEANL